MEPIIVSEPFEQLAVDTMGPLPTTERGNRFIVLFVDNFTKWAEGFAVSKADSVTIAQLLVEEIICRYGAPRKLLSDCGTPFISELAKQVYQLLHVKKLSTTPYHPQTDGQVERLNHTIKTMLATYVQDNQKLWDQYLPYALFAYRTGVHASTKETPFYLTFGRDARLPMNKNSRTRQIPLLRFN
jgi:transposase InsO family protein